jgi:RNA polymerase sigma factor (sigma-70 family)
MEHDVTTMQVRRAVQGDAASLAWLVERFTPILLVQARHRLRSALGAHCEPEDLVQDTWVTALPRLRDLQERDGRCTPVLLRFLGQILVNRYGTLLQKHILGKPLREAEPHGATGTGGALGRLAAAQTGIVNQAIRSEAIARMQAAIAELSETDQSVVVLRSIEQVSLRTTAQLLGIAENTVAVRHYRALRRLRERLPDSVFADLDDV